MGAVQAPLGAAVACVVWDDRMACRNRDVYRRLLPHAPIGVEDIACEIGWSRAEVGLAIETLLQEELIEQVG